MKNFIEKDKNVNLVLGIIAFNIFLFMLYFLFNLILRDYQLQKILIALGFKDNNGIHHILSKIKQRQYLDNALLFITFIFISVYTMYYYLKKYERNKYER